MWNTVINFKMFTWGKILGFDAFGSESNFSPL